MTADVTAIRAALASRFTVDEQIGEGGMAVVFRGLDPRHDGPVAIKVLRPELAVALGAERFLREISIESRLQHAHVLPLLASGQAGAYLYIVTPFAEGGSLADRLARERHLSLDEAIRITREVGDALSHAHANGVIHRDVKPANILLHDGKALIGDFGVAKAVADVDLKTITDSGVVLGTPSYMSPEQAIADGRVDARADLYSLACVLYEMLCGEPPFIGRTVQAVVARHLGERPPSLSAVRPDLPPALSAVIGKALAKVPAERFTSVEEFLVAAEAAARGENVPSLAPSRRLRPTVLTLAAVLALGAGWLVLRPKPVTLSRSRVVVFPLATRGPGVASTGVGADVSYLIEAALEQAGPLKFIDVTNRLDERQLANPEVIAGSAARRIARAQGAAFYVQGVVQGHGDSLTVILRLFDVKGDSLLLQHSVAGRVSESPIHHLGIDAIKGLLPALIDPTHVVDLTPLRSRRANAVALWMQGEREYRHGQFSAARSLYERALAEDSALALAAVKGAQASGWLHDHARGIVLVNLALARDSLLPPRYVPLARGLGTYFAGKPDSAVFWLKAAVAMQPGWSEALAALGEVYHHQLPDTAPLDSLADAMFTAAMAADSGFAPPIFHSLESQFRRGPTRQTERLFSRFAALGPDPQLLLHVSLMRECVNDPARMKWNAHVGANAMAVLVAAKELAVAGSRLACAEAGFRAILNAPSAGRSERWASLMGLFSILVSTGRGQEARMLVDSASVRTGAARSLYIIGASAGADMAKPAAELEAYARQTYGERYERIPSAENLWVLAVWLHSSGDTVRLRMLDSTLADKAARSLDARDAFYATAVHARAVLATDTARAITLLRSVAPALPGNVGWGFGNALPADHLLLAQLLLSRHAYREAMAAASVFDHAEPVLFVPYVPASLAVRYRAATAVGDVVAARTFRARLEALNRGGLVDQ